MSAHGPGPSSSDFPPDAGVCEYCYNSLEGTGKAFGVHKTLTALVKSSISCPCCLIFLQTFRESNVEIGLRQETAERDKANLITSLLFLDGGIGRFHGYFYCGPISPTCSYAYGRVLSFCTSEEPISQRQIWSSSTGSISLSSRMPVVVDWISNCNASHPACKMDGLDPPELPKRVLDVGPADSEAPIKLITTQDTRGWYTALSHCWGTLQPLTTTLDTLHKRKRGIEAHLLPKTFYDAVQVSRAVGIRYLWIDSLCIVQDDSQDWEIESAQMANVYQNAYVTLSASAASDSSEGFNWPFQPSIHVKYDECKMGYFRTQTNTYNTVTESPLGNRAWVLQETMLSRRVVYFAEDQLYWVCATSHASEDGLVGTIGVPYVGSYDWGRPYSTMRYSGPIEQLEDSKQDWYNSWQEIACIYNQLEITNPCDKLAALAGITSVMQRNLDDTPFLGLWRHNLLADLVWVRKMLPDLPHTPRRVVMGHAANRNLPSWSWLSIDGAIEFLTLNHGNSIINYPPVHERPQVMHTSVIWSGQPHTSSVISSELIVKSRLINLSLYDTSRLCGVPHIGGQSHSIDVSNCLSGEVQMDHMLGSDTASNKDLRALEVCWYRTINSDRKIYRCGILVVEPTGEGIFRRLGAGFIDSPGIYEPAENPFQGVKQVTVSLM